MINPINIHQQHQQLELCEGNYLIDFIGGWFVAPNDFKILLKLQGDANVVAINDLKWKVQTFEFGAKCKRFYEFKIEQSGIYTCNFENSESVEIKKHNIPIFSFVFPKLYDNRKIMIYIYRKF